MASRVYAKNVPIGLVSRASLTRSVTCTAECATRSLSCTCDRTDAKLVTALLQPFLASRSFPLSLLW
ncbi:unnamed protein product [Cochlearia groenlandica]